MVTMRCLAVALALAATIVTARAASPACSAVGIAAEDAALDRGLREPLVRYPWLTKAVPICAVLATGKPAEQFATLGGCLANACTDGQGTGCQEASRNVIASLMASAAARARSTRQRQQCGPPVVDAAERTPLETHLEILQALRRGDEGTVRRLSDGADADLAITVRSAASLERFYRAVAARQGDDVAELTRFVRATGMVSNELEASDFREERSGSSATVVRGNLPYPTYYRRVAGEWKSDLTRQKANMPDAAAVVPVAQLQIVAWETAAEIVTKGRGFGPVVASAADQCVLLGMFIVTTAPDRARRNCLQLMESRFGDTAANVPAAAPASAPAPSSATPARAAPASTAALPEDAAKLDAAIDARFIAWARIWFTDRYVRGSAHVAQARCQTNECRASGRFSFTRAGTPYQATFDASLSSDGAAGYAVTRLCYDDPSSGLSDCAR